MEPERKPRSSKNAWIIFLGVFLAGPAISLWLARMGGGLLALPGIFVLMPISSFVCAIIAAPYNRSIVQKLLLVVLLTVFFYVLEVSITIGGEDVLRTWNRH